MTTSTTVQDRPAVRYAAVRGRVTMATFGQIADRLPEVFAFLAEHGAEPVDAPFFRYLTIDMERELEVEAAVPVGPGVTGRGDVLVDELPAGRYVTRTHVGHPDGLVEVTDEVLRWAEAQGLALDVTPTPGGDRWGGRVERLLTDPAEEPDLGKWVTELAIRLAD